MALADSTKVDFLWKKLGFGVTKTAPNANKQAFNESIPSPLLMRGDKVWQSSGSIPSVKPSSNSSIVGVYQDAAGGSATVETTEDLSAPDNRTWKTNLTDWIPTEFGSTYLVKVYVDNAGAANPQSTGTQLFQAGSGNNDEWFFDYSSGVLNFNGTNIPTVIGTGVTGKSVYIVGARYIGPFGVGGGTGIGNLTVTDTTFTTDNAGSDIGFTTTGQGTVEINNTTALNVSVGTTAQRPSTPTTGDLRFNTTTTALEVYNGTGWVNVGDDTATITTQSFNGDNSTVAFTLSASATTASVIVSINGTVQAPTTAYAVSGTTLTFTEAPASGDVIEVRTITALTTVSALTNGAGDSVEITSGTVTIDTSSSARLTITDSTSTFSNDIITGQNRIAFADSGTVSFLDFTVTQFGQNNNTVLSSVKSINMFLDSNGGDSGQAFRIYNNTNPDSSPTENTFIFKVAEDGDVDITGTLNTHTIPSGTGTLALKKTPQIVTSTTTRNTTNSSFQDVTGYTASLTTTEANSKLRVSVNVTRSGDAGKIKLVRTVGATNTDIIEIPFLTGDGNFTIAYIDSPGESAGTSVTYKLQHATNGSGTVYVNFTGTNNQISIEEL